VFHHGKLLFGLVDGVAEALVEDERTGERYQLTSGKKSSSGAQWPPDSRRLAFMVLERLKYGEGLCGGEWRGLIEECSH
jgi:hypothetical protein